MTAQRVKRPLRCERLEDRLTPALFGNPWVDPGHLTLSFVPDGTDVAGAQSALDATLGGTMTSAAWHTEILKAFQTWNQYAKLNIAVVGDNGQALGTAGVVQGNPNFGDIRISARPLSDNVLAVTTPFDLFNSWAGEIVLNSNKVFGKGAAAGQDDLYTVLLQESGHALGLDNSTDAGSVMYETYGGPKIGLNNTDITAIRALYGARSADAYDLSGSNDTLSNADTITIVNSATQLDGTDGTTGDHPLVAAGDLTTLADVDTYAFKTAKSSADFSVAVLTGGISQLNAKISLYGPDGKLAQFKLADGTFATSAVAAADATSPFVVQVVGARADSTYKVVVEGATEDVFGVGAYKLAVGKAAAAAVQPPAAVGLIGNDYHTNDTRDKAFFYGDARPGADARWDFTGTGSISNDGTTDIDWYKIHTKADTQQNLVVLVSALDFTLLNPSVELYDRNGVKLAVEVLSNTGGTVILQYSNIVRDTDYFLKVAAASPTVKNSGNYFVAADFRSAPVTLSTFASGTLQGTTNQAATGFTTTRTQSVYFELSGQAGVNAAVRLTVYDANNVAVFTIKAKGGDTTGANVLLAPGTYTVRFAAAGVNGAPLPSFDFRARYTLGSDPIGIQPIDSTTTPTVVTYNSTTSSSTFLSPSTTYTAPAGTATTGALTWSIAPPPPSFFAVTAGDLYSDPWW